MIRWSNYLAFPLMVLLAVLQLTLVRYLKIGEVTPQLLFLVVVAWGLLREVGEGCVWAFCAGISSDLFSPTPLGSTAFSFILIVLLIFFVRQLFPAKFFALPILFAALGTLVYLVLDYLILRLFQYDLSWSVVVSTTPLILWHAIFILPIYAIMSWVERRINPRAVQI